MGQSLITEKSEEMYYILSVVAFDNGRWALQSATATSH